MVLLVGLDLSLRETGLATCDDKQASSLRVISVSPPKNMRGASRLSWYNNYFTCLFRSALKTDKKVYVCLEGYAMGVSASKSRSFDIGELGGIVKMVLFNNNIPYVIVPPTCLKKFISGKGNAPKDIIIKEVYKKYSFDTNNNNHADAFALLKICECYFLNKYPELAYQKDVLKGLCVS